MRVLVLGGGVIGVTTAWALHRRGHQVELVERNKSTSLECSFANGGQLSYNHAEPWSNPKALRQGLSWLGKKDAPLMFRLQADPAMWLWTLRFLMNCTAKNAHRNSADILRIALYSREVMHRLEQEVKLDFDYAKTGRLFIFEEQQDFEGQWRHSQFQEQLGVGAHAKRLTPQECVEVEPALHTYAKKMVGGIFAPEDESGDICKFTQGLADHLQKQGVKFHYNTPVKHLLKKGRTLAGIETGKGELTADAYVMSLGCGSAQLLKGVGIHAPIYPLKGYSISVNIKGCKREDAPRVSLTHSAKKIAYSTLGDVLRLAGTAEFAGYNDKVVKHRINILKHDTLEMFPKGGDVQNASEWACLRPMTPDGPPIIGPTHIENLFMNTGQGFLGWTEAAGSAAVIADVIDGKKPEIDLAPFSLERYVW